MGGHLLRDVRQFLHALEALQRELSRLFVRKRQALSAPHPEQLLAIAEDEAALTAQLQELVARRSAILEQAREAGLKVDSLADLVEASAEEGDRRRIAVRIQHAREQAELLRRESWIHWVIAHRTHKHYSDLLEIVAHAGRQAPTYNHKSGENHASPGGALLDASA